MPCCLLFVSLPGWAETTRSSHPSRLLTRHLRLRLACVFVLLCSG
jgi:hypothetical protein